MSDIATTQASLMINLEKFCAPFEEEAELASEQENNLPRQLSDIPLTKSHEITTPTMAEVISELSTEVSTDTDLCYKRYMASFNAYLISNNYIAPNETIFRQGDLPADTPFYIVTWIMSLCDTLNPDGTEKDLTGLQNMSGYMHGTKLRAALTYGFGRDYDRGPSMWRYIPETQKWNGNPSISVIVTRYMISLRKRKRPLGDHISMSSRAVTADILRKIYNYNQAEGRADITCATDSAPPPGKDCWGTARRRKLVHAVALISFHCLLRIDETLNLRYEDLTWDAQEDTVIIQLESRKTHQFGGSKPYKLWRLPNDNALCPVLGLALWIQAAGLDNPSGYIFRIPSRNGRGPVSGFNDSPISSGTWLEYFRNNLVDIFIDPMMYGGHSFRRGGLQYFLRERRWPIHRLCNWGGWSKDFDHSSIIRYMFSWNDDPYDDRDDYLNPNRVPTRSCYTCGRTCHC